MHYNVDAIGPVYAVRYRAAGPNICIAFLYQLILLHVVCCVIRFTQEVRWHPYVKVRYYVIRSA